MARAARRRLATALAALTVGATALGGPAAAVATVSPTEPAPTPAASTTATSEPTANPAPTATPEATATPAPTAEPTPTPTAAPTPTPTASTTTTTTATSSLSTTAIAPLRCDAGTVYATTAGGSLTGYTTTSATTSYPVTPGFPMTSQVNLLGMNEDGTVAYGAQRSGTFGQITSVARYSVANGWEVLPNSSYTGPGPSSSFVGGAVSPTSGIYYIGGFHNITSGTTTTRYFRVVFWNPTTQRLQFLTDILLPTSSTTSTANGDFAFDAAGNMYIVLGSTTTSIYSVPSALIEAKVASPDTPGVSTVTAKLLYSSTTVGMSSINGIAFDSDGGLFLSNATSIRKFDSTTFAPMGAVRTDLSNVTDLASCALPPTLVINKDVVARVDPAHQFRLSLANSAGEMLSATTTGSATDIQPEAVGPTPIRTGTTYTIAETLQGASGASVTSLYGVRYQCVNLDGVVLQEGSAASFAFTIKPEWAGESITCTFRNAPLTATITVSKELQDDAGARTPAAGWSMTMGARATTGTVAPMPSTDPATKTTAIGADGRASASWTLQFGTAASRADVTVAETMQAGYAFVSGTCDIVLLGATAPTTVTITSTTATIPGVEPGARVSCTFVNRELPTTLTLAKQVSSGTLAPSTWQLSATAQSAGALAGPTGTTGANARVTPGVAYRLAESGGPATYVQNGAWQCRTASGASVPVSAQGDVTLARGTQVTCTVVNATATMTLLKYVDGVALQPSAFDLAALPATLTGLSARTVDGATQPVAANTFEVRPGHAYALSERSDATNTAYLSLRLERYIGPAGATVDHTNAALWTTVANPADVRLAPGEHAIFRFVNAPVDALTLPVTGGLGADAYRFVGVAILTIAMLAALIVLVRSRRSPRRLDALS